MPNSLQCFLAPEVSTFSSAKRMAERAGFLWGWAYTAITRPASLAAQSVSTAIFLNIVFAGAIKDHLAAISVTAILIATLVNSVSVRATGWSRPYSLLSRSWWFWQWDFARFSFPMAAGFTTHFGRRVARANRSPSTRGGLADRCGDDRSALGLSGLGAFCPDGRARCVIPAKYTAGFCSCCGRSRRSVPFCKCFVLLRTDAVGVASVPVSSSVATEMLTRVFGAAAAALMAAGMLISSFGALQTGLAPAMRVPYAMANDGLYFRLS